MRAVYAAGHQRCTGTLDTTMKWLPSMASAPRRPVILTFVRHYLPGGKCGPIQSVANLVNELREQFDFRIVSLDRDVGDSEAYAGIEANRTWRTVSGAQVFYLAPWQARLPMLAGILRETPHDCVYLNSAFDPSFTIAPLLARRLHLVPRKPWMIAPRGEFSVGALTVKAAKKNAFLRTARMSGLYRGLTWQATSAFERDDVIRVMGSAAKNICVVPNIAARPEAAGSPPPRRTNDPLRVCFLSRIALKKNLHFAIEALAHVSASVRFDIYGPIEDENYWAHCQDAMARLPSHIVARYRGSVRHDDVHSLLAGYELFFLPTLGENFGHVIHEALSAGTPVLIADTTPWRDLADSSAGWDLPLDRPEAFAKVIDYMARLPPDGHAQLRSRARSLIDKRAADRTVVDASSRLLLAITSVR